MATMLEIRKLQQLAEASMVNVLTAMSTTLGVTPHRLDTITYRRDPAYETMLKVQAIAEWLAELEAALTKALADAPEQSEKAGKAAAKKADKK